jgi:hypothetical protein
MRGKKQKHRNNEYGSGDANMINNNNYYDYNQGYGYGGYAPPSSYSPPNAYDQRYGPYY